ncbi:uncharacterized protein FA14DRAFT_154520 [Meira miltonrushii]|uniref:Uncharacterized protein n=1 Tax=Meira miltonrushii TaxID=1280837 RepID=A0A316VGG4_9BASI|nr:uncharacterized protein FA14DRAFT_154520 [Meira miltonrushii]PWN35091.1 hypothetical protein FA14DRAFT_154520 [Meira miltonrushii]
MRFNIYASVLVIGVATSCILAAPVPDDGSQSSSSTSSSVVPTNTPNSFSNSNNIIGPVNNNQNSNKNNNQNNMYGDEGRVITIPVQIDTSMLQGLMAGGTSTDANIVHKNIVSTNQLPPGAIPFSQFVQDNGGNIPPPDSKNVRVVKVTGLPPQEAKVDTGNHVDNNNDDPNATPTPASNTTSSSTSTNASSTAPPPPSPTDNSNSSGDDDAKPQKRQQEWQIRNYGDHDTRYRAAILPMMNEKRNYPTKPNGRFSTVCAKRDGCGEVTESIIPHGQSRLPEEILSKP